MLSRFMGSFCNQLRLLQQVREQSYVASSTAMEKDFFTFVYQNKTAAATEE